MAGDDLLRTGIQLLNLSCDEFMAGAVETVLADSQLFSPAIGNTVAGSVIGNCAVEAGFKSGNLL